MADKLHILTSNLIRFVAGERVTAEKLNAQNEYFSRSLKELAEALGDIRSQGFPHINNGIGTFLSGAWNPYYINSKGRPLDIVNLARIIGPASNLNPKMAYNDTAVKFITEVIPANTCEYELKYAPKETIDSSEIARNYIIVCKALNGNGTILGQASGLSELFNADLLYKVVNKTIYFYKPLDVDCEVSYQIAPLENIDGGINYLGAGFNVIPDPNQNEKLVIEEEITDEAYIIRLGNAKAQQSKIFDKAIVDLDSEDYNFDEEILLPKWMWDGEDSPFSETSGEEQLIPAGFLQLKDITTNVVYTDANYYFLDRKTIKVNNVSLCLDDDFCLLTVGTDITTSIDDLRNKWFLHSHDGSYGERRIKVSSLLKEFTSGSFGISLIEENELPMYLQRKGYQYDLNRANADNAMIGDLLLGRVNFDSSNPETQPILGKNIVSAESLEDNESRKILFGNNSTFIQRNETGELVIENSPTGSIVTIPQETININSAVTNINSSFAINTYSENTSSINTRTLLKATQELLRINSSLEDSEEVYVNKEFIAEKREGYDLGNFELNADINVLQKNYNNIEEENYSEVIEIFPTEDASRWVPQRMFLQNNSNVDGAPGHPTPSYGTASLDVKVSRKNPNAENSDIVEYKNILKDYGSSFENIFTIPVVGNKTLYKISTETIYENLEGKNLNHVGIWNNNTGTSEGSKPIKVYPAAAEKVRVGFTGKPNTLQIAGTLGEFDIGTRKTLPRVTGVSQNVHPYKVDMSNYFKECLTTYADKIEVTEEGSYIQFTVTDNGVSEDLPYIPYIFMEADSNTEEDGRHAAQDRQFLRNHLIMRIKDTSSGEISWLRGNTLEEDATISDKSPTEFRQELGTEYDFYIHYLSDSSTVFDRDRLEERLYQVIYFRPHITRTLCASAEEFKTKILNDTLEIAFFWGYKHIKDTCMAPTIKYRLYSDNNINSWYYLLTVEDEAPDYNLAIVYHNENNLVRETNALKIKALHAVNENGIPVTGYSRRICLDTVSDLRRAEITNYNNLGSSLNYINIVRDAAALVGEGATSKRVSNFTISGINQSEDSASLKISQEWESVKLRSLGMTSGFNLILQYYNKDFVNFVNTNTSKRYGNREANFFKNIKISGNGFDTVFLYNQENGINLTRFVLEKIFKEFLPDINILKEPEDEVRSKFFGTNIILGYDGNYLSRWIQRDNSTEDDTYSIISRGYDYIINVKESYTKAIDLLELDLDIILIKKWVNDSDA